MRERYGLEMEQLENIDSHASNMVEIGMMTNLSAYGKIRLTLPKLVICSTPTENCGFVDYTRFTSSLNLFYGIFIHLNQNSPTIAKPSKCSLFDFGLFTIERAETF